MDIQTEVQDGPALAVIAAFSPMALARD